MNKYPTVVDGKRTKEYCAWYAMKDRVLQPNASSKERSRNSIYCTLSICDRWLSKDGYQNFRSDVGPAPSKKHILDCRDNSKGYYPDNVKWSTPSESNINKSNARILTAFGISKPISQWADDLGVSPTTIQRRIKISGWSIEDSVSRRPGPERKTTDEWYMQIAGRVALRGTCIRRAVGCVIVDKHKFVISTGYNSVPTGIDHCTDKPCEGANCKSGEGLSLCIARHAEDVALMKCKDVYQVDTIYSTTAPCIHCVRRLLDTSCKRIVFNEDYPHSEQSKLLWESKGNEWCQLELI